jgi:4-hydroxybenzoate polyprenyltransferase
MEDLSRPPTKIERLVASFLSAVATLIFGAVSVFIFSSVPISYPALAIFTVLFLVSAVMFCRAAFTARRRLSNRGLSRLAWVLLVGGVACAALALLFGSGTHRLLLLGSSLSCVAYGLAGLRGRAQ